MFSNYRGLHKTPIFFWNHTCFWLVLPVHFRAFSTSQPWAIWHTASAQSGVTSSPSSTGSLLLFPRPKIFNRYIIFLTSTQYVATLPTAMPPTQFTWHFHCDLFTLRYRCVLFYNLRGISKESSSRNPTTVCKILYIMNFLVQLTLFLISFLVSFKSLIKLIIKLKLK